MTRWIDADELKDWGERVPLTGDGGIDINDFDEKLASMPAADVAPVRHGHWEPNNDRYGWACTACGHFIQRDFVTDITITSELLPRYCPNCGADMRGGQDEY